MADYFHEMSWEPLGEGQQPDHLLHLARLFRDYNMFQELGVANRLPPPASKESVENLPVVDVPAGYSCPVCLKETDKETKMRKMPCKHSFHSECILPWLEKTNSCPVCRYELPTDDETYEAFRKQKIREKQREADIENLHNSMFS